MDDTPPAARPLGERFPAYLAAFAVGLGTGGLVGVVIWLATSARLIDAVGYTYSALGAVLLLTGGARGSGYPRPGREAGARRDPVERRLALLRRGPDPRAFWEVVAGFAYLALGVVLTVVLAAPGP